MPGVDRSDVPVLQKRERAEGAVEAAERATVAPEQRNVLARLLLPLERTGGVQRGSPRRSGSYRFILAIRGLIAQVEQVHRLILDLWRTSGEQAYRLILAPRLNRFTFAGGWNSETVSARSGHPIRHRPATQRVPSGSA